MTLEIQGIARDLRCDTWVAYGQIPVQDYLALVGDAFDRVEVQRKRQQHPAYTRLKSDVADGALIPTITLAVDPTAVQELLPLIEKKELAGLARALTTTYEVFILDGLQRTFIIRDLQREGHRFKEGQTIHLEIWLEKSVQNFIYRVLILNAGQKPMSARHQVKLIFLTVRSSLEAAIDGLRIIPVGRERQQPGEYPLDRMISSYLCFFLETPEVSDDNLTGRGLIREDLFNPALLKMGRRFTQYQECLSGYTEIDRRSHTLYGEQSKERLPGINKLMGSESMLNACFAAAGRTFSGNEEDTGVTDALQRLTEELSDKKAGADPLGLERLDQRLQTIQPCRHNVAYETRMMLTRGWQTFFEHRGGKPLADCW